MNKIESIKEELAVLREEYKNIFIFLLAMLTGSFTSFYQVLAGKVEFHILILSALGLVTSVFIMVFIKKIRLKMDDNIKKLEELV